MSDLQTQLRAYYSYVEREQSPVELPDVLAVGEPVRSITERPRATARGPWRTSVLVFAAAAAVVLVAIGLLPLLLGNGVSDPAEEPTPPEVTTTTSVNASTTTTTEADSSVVDDEWPDYAVTQTTVGFVAAAPPENVACPGLPPTNRGSDTGPLGPHQGSWFNDVCYAIPADGLLYRTADGVTWESADAADALDDIIVRDDVLLSVAIAEDGAPELVVGRSVDVETWTFTELPLPIPEEPSTIGRSLTSHQRVTAGPAGFLITADVSYEIDVEAIVGDVLGVEVAMSMSELRMTANTIEIVTETGEPISIDLIESGYMDDIDAFLDTLGDGAPRLETGAFDAMVPVAWWSPDGVKWRPVEREGPMLNGHIEEVEAIADGFLVASIGPQSDDIEAGIVWFTADGTSWTRRNR